MESNVSTNPKEIRLKKLIGEEFADVIYVLGQKSINFESSAQKFAKIAFENPEILEHFLSFRMFVESQSDKKYPKRPYFYLQNLDEKKLKLSQYRICEDWNKERKNGYRSAKNVIYENDYLETFLSCPKYPVTAIQSLSDFLDKTEFRIEKSGGKETPQLEDLTFVQLMFGQDKNGNVMRFARVVELNPCEMVKNGTKVNGLNFSISLKVMPDDDLNHSSCVVRIDSKMTGHKNILPQNCGDKVFNQLYKNGENKDLHFHIFDRQNQFIYLGKPLSSNTISLANLIGLSKQNVEMEKYPYHIQQLLTGENVEKLKKIDKTIDLAQNRLDDKKSCDQMASWNEQFSALRQSIDLMDSAFSIMPEKELEDVKEGNFGIYSSSKDLV